MSRFLPHRYERPWIPVDLALPEGHALPAETQGSRLMSVVPSQRGASCSLSAWREVGGGASRRLSAWGGLPMRKARSIWRRDGR